MARIDAQLGLPSFGLPWLLLGSLMVSACVLGLDNRGPARSLVRPAPLAETPGPRPADCASDCRYRPGYWHFQGGGYVWVSGRWEREAGLVVDSTR